MLLVVIPLRINITNNSFLYIFACVNVVIPLRINITNNSSGFKLCCRPVVIPLRINITNNHYHKLRQRKLLLFL